MCYEERFDEMKLTCAYCGMFEDEDDILVCCQGPDCSLRSADYEIPGPGGARWQNCPWCPKPAAVVGVDVSDEEKYFMTRLEEENYAALMIQRRWRWSRKRIVLRAAREKKLQEKSREARRRPGGSQRQEKGGDSQGNAIHLEGRGEGIEKAPEQGAGEPGTRLMRPLQENRMVICGGERHGCEPYRIVPITVRETA